MAKYIDAELLKKMFKDAYGIDISFDRVPAVDVVPVVHAHWIIIDRNGFFVHKCSHCGYSSYSLFRHKYCGDCGAKMDEEVER